MAYSYELALTWLNSAEKHIKLTRLIFRSLFGKRSMEKNRKTEKGWKIIEKLIVSKCSKFLNGWKFDVQDNPNTNCIQPRANKFQRACWGRCPDPALHLIIFTFSLIILSMGRWVLGGKKTIWITSVLFAFSYEFSLFMKLWTINQIYQGP